MPKMDAEAKTKWGRNKASAAADAKARAGVPVAETAEPTGEGTGEPEGEGGEGGESTGGEE